MVVRSTTTTNSDTSVSYFSDIEILRLILSARPGTVDCIDFHFSLHEHVVVAVVCSRTTGQPFGSVFHFNALFVAHSADGSLAYCNLLFPHDLL